MAKEPSASHPAVRHDWLFEVSTLLQRALCEEAFSGDIEGALLRIVPKLPLPGHRAEELALSGLLLQMIWGGQGNSRDEIVSQIQKLISAAQRRPGFSLAQKAADHIAQHYSAPLRFRQAARALGCDETKLRREFKAEYGISPREYHQRLRVQRALTLMAAGPTKTSAVARAVGYASESHFYKAVRRLTGSTPANLQPATRLLKIAAGLVPRRQVGTSLRGRRDGEFGIRRS